jgi:hypothetical protein
MPDREELVCRRISGSFDRMVFEHERIQFDDLAMAV